MSAPLLGTNANGTGGFVALLATAGGALSVATVASAADAGLTGFRNTALTNVAVSLKNTAGNLYGLRVINPGANVAYVKLYNAPVANVNIGNAASTPLMVVQCGPSNNTTAGNVNVFPGFGPIRSFSAGITICATNALADSDTAAPVGTPYVEALYN